MDSIFQTIFSKVGPPIVGAVDGIVTGLQGWMRPWLLSAIVLYVVCKMLWATFRGSGNPFGDALAEMVACSIIVYAATEAAGLGVQARNLLLSGISREIGAVITGAVGVPVVGPSLFDDLWTRSWATGLEVYNALPGFYLKTIGLMLIVVVYWFVALAAVGLAFAIWITSYVMVALLVSLWPLGVGLFAFPWTRGFAWGWLRSAVANVLLQTMAVLVASVLLAVLTGILRDLQAGLPGTGIRNEIREIGTLIGACLITGLFAWLMKQLPGLAAAMAHGFTGFGQTAIPGASAMLNAWQHHASHPVPPAGGGGAHATADAPHPMPRGQPPGQALG